MSITLRSPYTAASGTWLRGNLHTHSTLSDGVLAPSAVLAAYEARGYDFLALSDHDLVAPAASLQAETGMTLLYANEVTANGPHIQCLGSEQRVEPCEDRQIVLEEIARVGGFSVLNHPNWGERFDHFSFSRMEGLSGYIGVEVYNGIIEVLPGSALALDKWDRLLSLGRELWAFANDDFHAPAHLGRGWNVARCADRSVGAILHALRSGHFYASTGVSVSEIEVAGASFRVAAADATHIRFIGQWGRELAFVAGPEAVYEAIGNEGSYVRAEAYGPGYGVAWTQPAWVERG